MEKVVPTLEVCAILYKNISSKISSMLITDSFQSGKSFWLANQIAITKKDGASWGIFDYAEKGNNENKGILIDRSTALVR